MARSEGRGSRKQHPRKVRPAKPTGPSEDPEEQEVPEDEVRALVPDKTTVRGMRREGWEDRTK